MPHFVKKLHFIKIQHSRKYDIRPFFVINAYQINITFLAGIVAQLIINVTRGKIPVHTVNAGIFSQFLNLAVFKSFRKQRVHMIGIDHNQTAAAVDNLAFVTKTTAPVTVFDNPNFGSRHIEILHIVQFRTKHGHDAALSELNVQNKLFI